ncbi:hypothetical protein FQN50_000611 [Emmonsiellopsis sp. PD_5]|nr:hypothetical protein FQN50_000611 [Emmonsiellopsis sp. PD_5]
MAGDISPQMSASALRRGGADYYLFSPDEAKHHDSVEHPIRRKPVPIKTGATAISDGPVSPVDSRYTLSPRAEGETWPPISPVEELPEPLYNKNPSRPPVDMPSQQQKRHQQGPSKPHGYGRQAPQGNQQHKQPQRYQQGPTSRGHRGQASQPAPQQQPNRHGGNTTGSSDRYQGTARTAHYNPYGDTSRGEQKGPKRKDSFNCFR